MTTIAIAKPGFTMNILKNLSARKTDGKTAAPAQSQSAAAQVGLPLIRHWPVTRQFRVLLAILGTFLLAAALLATLQNREAAQTAVYVSTATEMQMLSQRIANSAQQAAQGIPVAFVQLKESRDRFNGNLKLLMQGG